VGCKGFLAEYLPLAGCGLEAERDERPDSIGRVKMFHGNFLVVVKAAAYLATLGREGVPEVAKNAVLNANYLMALLKAKYTVAYNRVCMHEFDITLEREKAERGVTAMDIAKMMADRGIHAPTMYFPLIVHEALMVEPTETESKQTMDEIAAALLAIYDEAMADPAAARAAPVRCVIGRPDEVKAARAPVTRYRFA
jgi:glycine dehydrogenase subunit 2